MKLAKIILASLLLGGSVSSQALQLLSLSPQGEVAQIRQVSVLFDQPLVNFGDPKATAPITLQCSDGPASQGSGRWLSDRQWVYNFATDLPPGVTCSVQLKPDLKSVQGQTITRASSFSFNSGGPFVKRILPGAGTRIDEEQVFILQLSGPAEPASVLAHVGCEMQGVGERIAVRLIDGPERATLLASQNLQDLAAQSPLSMVTLACQRRLTPGARIQLVFGQVSTVAAGSQTRGLANRLERRFDYRVREPFAASLSCERENAQSACLPIRPIRLSFNAPVTRKLLEGIRLRTAKDSFAPSLDQETGDADSVVSSISFKPPLPELAALTLVLPAGFTDASGRSLGQADSFPMKLSTGPMPPLAKFAAAPFGVIERFAEPDGVALLPITLRHVETALSVKGLSPGAPGGKLSDLNPQADAEIIAWFRKVQRYDSSSVSRRQAATDSQTPLPRLPDDKPDSAVQTRMLSLLQGQPGVKTLALPQASSGDPRPFEVVGIPLSPGFHVVEVASPKLGASLLDPRFGASRTLYVRSSVLVTNLGLHFKLGRDNALAWVTTLDRGRPVANARVVVSDCRGHEVANAISNAQGLASFSGINPKAPVCEGDEAYTDAYFVSARAQQPAADGKGVVDDLAFAWSDWNKGIEPWRFNLPTSHEAQPDEIAHTIFDRTLLRAGETVSMKHLLRSQTSQGFGLTSSQPDTLVISHVGSGQQSSQPLVWRKTATGGQSAESQFVIPPAAKLGLYEVELRGGANRQSFFSGQFRVEEFRLPVLQGRITTAGKGPLVNARSAPLDMQVNYVSGGAAKKLPVRVSALLRSKNLSFVDYEAFSFAPPRERNTATRDEEESSAGQETRVIADKLPLTLDQNGAGKLNISTIPASRQPQELLLEASYADPNGELQTLRSTQTLWPARVIAGIKTEGWVSSSQKIKFQALALDLSGKPQAGVALDVQATTRITTSSRKRLVGGFYSYDNQTRLKELGSVCSGKSDSRGLLLCETTLAQAGEIELIVTAKDSAGNSIQAASSVYITRHGELWFGGENSDRIDLIPEKKSYQPGETARFQVRMPFRFATALVAVEREGILQTEVVELNGQDPTLDIKVKDSWGPNVYVSVLALRGRLREVPWYSFFTWGFKAPREWWTSFWYAGREYVAPTAMVDLSKPAFRLGVAEIRVGSQAHQLTVSVTTDKPSYAVRSQAQVTINVKLPNGQPAAHAEVALAAVDQALLELMPNDSWNLLEAMLQRRAWGVETSTAQMEIIGRRHYGRKAVAAGGGGGHSGTRELLDTLLLWNPAIQLDAKGSATLSVPLNDALTSFKIVAVADVSTGLFGSGSTTIRATQDLQIISGLPPLVREDDLFRAQITLRNTTQHAMKVRVTPRATLLSLTPQNMDIPAGDARELGWMVKAPAQLAQTRSEAILWEIEAKDTLSGARDALKASQRIVPAVPLTVQQATLVQIDKALTLAVAPPADAIATNGVLRGGLKLSLQSRLADGLPGVKDWFANYPFTCLEQKASQALGLRNAKLWQSLLAQLPSYLDGDGLASYFPPRDGEADHGSDTLTAYLLAASHEAASSDPAFALSPDLRAVMERGLVHFVTGKIQRKVWSPGSGQAGDLDVRKLAALEALSRSGKAQARMLDSIAMAPNQWPTHAVIDWLNILQRVSDVPERDRRLAQARQILRSRISYQGTKLVFSTEQGDYWWWLMQNGDVNSARLMLAVMDEPTWRDDIGRLASGLIARQHNGAWQTTTANLWGALALEKFSARFEAVPVTGNTRTSTSTGAASVDWSRVTPSQAAEASGTAQQKGIEGAASAPWFGAPEAPGKLKNTSLFLPWGKSAAKDTLSLTHSGAGKPWLTLQSVAAVDLKQPFFAGYQIRKTITPVAQANPGLPAGSYSRGDVLRITLEVNASADMSWAVISDPVPAGATILGSGLGRDSEIATQGNQREGEGWSAFEERSFESFRSYYAILPKGLVKLQYTLRLNNVGEFSLPPTRVQAMYAPEMFGEIPNARVKVEAAR